MIRIAALLAMTACVTRTADTDTGFPEDTDEDTGTARAGECRLADTGLSFPASSDTALPWWDTGGDSGWDTGYAGWTDWGFLTEACVEPGVSWEGYTVSYVRPTDRPAEYYCAMYQAVQSSEPVDTCPGCDFAFDVTYAPGTELGTEYCNYSGIDKKFLKTVGLGVDSLHYGVPVVMYSMYGSWYPLQSYQPYVDSLLVVEQRDDAVHIDWDYAYHYP